MIRIPRDNEPDLVLPDETEEIAWVTSSRNFDADRWTELHLLKTPDGAYVATETGVTNVSGEHTRCAAWVCKDHAEVIARLGHGWLAKKLYAQAGIDDSVSVP